MVLYVFIGCGYGYFGQGLISVDCSNWYGSNNGNLNMIFCKVDGIFVYDEIYVLNEVSENGLVMVMLKFKNFYNWYGLFFIYIIKFGDYFDFYGGIDYCYYKGIYINELVDFYGGDFYVDFFLRKSVLVLNNVVVVVGFLFVNQKLKVGDIVYCDFDGYVMFEGVFV